MKYNQKLKNEIEEYKNYVILVEGQKDVLSLKSLGFEKIYAIHKNGVSLKERIEQICSLIEKKEKVCILTDFDRKGKQFYMQIKSMLQERGVRLDSSLRGILLKTNISHIEGLSTFIEKTLG